MSEHFTWKLRNLFYLIHGFLLTNSRPLSFTVHIIALRTDILECSFRKRNLALIKVNIAVCLKPRDTVTLVVRSCGDVQVLT